MQGMGEEASVFLRDYLATVNLPLRFTNISCNVHLKPIDKQAPVPKFWLFRDETTSSFVYETDKLRHFTLNGS